MMMAAPFASFMFLIWLALIGLGVYSLVLFIKLAHRGIRALDIYISKNENGQY
ncbi:MAG: hypothetical protein AAGU27_25780 [Dehalobacterium sp.]